MPALGQLSNNSDKTFIRMRSSALPVGVYLDDDHLASTRGHPIRNKGAALVPSICGPVPQRSALSVQAKPWTPGLQSKIEPISDSENSSESTTAHESDDENTSVGEGSTHGSIDVVSFTSDEQHVGKRSLRQQRTALTSGAKPWMPQSPCAERTFRPPPGLADSVLPPAVHYRFAKILAAASKAAMQSCPSVKDIHRVESGVVWSLVVCVGIVPAAERQAAFKSVKTAILRCAEKSNGVYIVGYETNPFVPSNTGFGFRAQFALVEDETTACWDFLTQGMCCRGGACHWRHPMWQMPIDIVLEVL